MTNERKKKTNLILGTEKTTFDLDLYILPIIGTTESKICYILVENIVINVSIII